MTNFAVPRTTQPYETLGTIVNRMETIPAERRQALHGFIQAVAPMKDDPLTVRAKPFKFSGSQAEPFRDTAARLDLADVNATTLAGISRLAAAADDYARRFFGPAGLSKSERDALLAKLVEVFRDPRKTLKSIGDRNASRSAVRGLLNGEVARAKAHTAATGYAVPAAARTLALHRAANEIDTLDRIGLTALERRFLEFDRGLQGELVQARLQAMRALYGELGAAYATTLMFAGQVAVPAYSRPAAERALNEDLTARYARLYSEGFALAGAKQLTADEQAALVASDALQTWKERHDIRVRAFSEATRAVSAAAAEVSRQLSAVLNAVSGSGSLSGSQSISESWPTIELDY